MSSETMDVCGHCTHCVGEFPPFGLRNRSVFRCYAVDVSPVNMYPMPVVKTSEAPPPWCPKQYKPPVVEIDDDHHHHRRSSIV